MYQPLLELPSGATNTFIASDRLLGEAAGSLFANSHRIIFEAHGGAIYPPWQLANRNVVGRRTRRPAGITTTATTTISERGVESTGGLSSSSLSLLLSSMWNWGRRRRGEALRRVLSPVVSLLPLLRLILPFVVPPSSDCNLLRLQQYPSHGEGDEYQQQQQWNIRERRRRGVECSERVSAIAFHPNRMLLAAAVDEGGDSARVVIYDVTECKEIYVLTHAFQRRVSALAWKPFSRDVLAVGCDGGVLLWSLSFTPTPHNSTILQQQREDLSNGYPLEQQQPSQSQSQLQLQQDQMAQCLFYRCTLNTRITCVNFSCCDGRYLACGSIEHIATHFHDIRLPPLRSLLLRSVSLEGGTEDIFFADDDTFAVRLVCGVNRIILITFPSCKSITVPTSSPVLKMIKARALGPNHFFLHCARVEGVYVAHVNPFIGVQIISLISTGLNISAGGIGGSVRRIACSGKRLYIALETGHLLMCHYGRRGVFTLIPIGVAEFDITHMSVFDGFTRGSLLAAVEVDQTVTFVPSYHA